MMPNSKKSDCKPSSRCHPERRQTFLRLPPTKPSDLSQSRLQSGWHLWLHTCDSCSDRQWQWCVGAAPRCLGWRNGCRSVSFFMTIKRQVPQVSFCYLYCYVTCVNTTQCPMQPVTIVSIAKHSQNAFVHSVCQTKILPFLKSCQEILTSIKLLINIIVLL